MKIPEISIKVSWSDKVKKSELPAIKTSKDAVNILKDIFVDNIHFVEQFSILFLSRANKVIGFKTIASGGIAGTVVDPKVAYLYAINTVGCCALIIAHNHPSGNLEPSDSDKLLTKKFVDAGKLLDINILDHIILTDEDYFSFADEGLIF